MAFQPIRCGSQTLGSIGRTEAVFLEKVSCRAHRVTIRPPSLAAARQIYATRMVAGVVPGYSTPSSPRRLNTIVATRGPKGLNDRETSSERTNPSGEMRARSPISRASTVNGFNLTNARRGSEAGAQGR